MPTRRNVCRFAALGCLLRMGALATAQTKDLPTVDGPEAQDLVKSLKGQLLHPKPTGGIEAVLLPSLTQKTVRPVGKKPLSDFASPDRDGRIVLLEAPPRDEAILLLRSADGAKEVEILRRPNAGPRSHAIGRPTLSTHGKLLAFVSNTRSVTFRDQVDVTVRLGSLEIWQTAEKLRLPVRADAVDRSLAWLAEDKSLLYSSLVGPDTLPAELVEAYSRASGTGLIPVVERKTPVVQRLDLATSKSTPLCLGRRTVVSTDGKTLLVEAMNRKWMLFDVTSGALTAANLPGLYEDDRVSVYEGGVIAIQDSDLAIYWGLPTTGASQRQTKGNSPLVGAKPMPSIKAARLSTGEFQTIIQHMDPRHEVVFTPNAAPK